MNDWLIFAATLAVQLFAAAYVYGKLSNAVQTNTESLTRAWSKIDNHEQRISRIEGHR